MESVKDILMRRDKLGSLEADEVIAEAMREVEWFFENGDGRSPETILREDFGLEPDYVYDIIPKHLL